MPAEAAPGTIPVDPGSASAEPGPSSARTRPGAGRRVLLRRAGSVLAVLAVVAWAVRRATVPGTAIVNDGGLPVLGALLAGVLRPATSPDFLIRVLDAATVTVAFAALGTVGALVIGLVGGVVLSDVAWGHRPSWLVRVLRLPFRASLVVVRSVHELVWALLFVSVLGLDPLVGVLAIAVPFGAQTAKVYAETFDNVPSGALAALRRAGARPVSAWTYGLMPAAAPLLGSYAFYRFECSIRSVVLLGVVGVGGLGSELVVSLQSRNWDEVWTLVGALLLLSAVVDLASARFRAVRAVRSCHDAPVGVVPRSLGRLDPASEGSGLLARTTPRSSRPTTGRWMVATGLGVGGLVVAWHVAGVSLAGLSSPRTARLTAELLSELWPPQLPPGGWPALAKATLDTLAMAVLAMVVAVVLTVIVGPAATLGAPSRSPGGRHRAGLVARRTRWLLARGVLLALRSVPPTVWAVVALLVLFPGVPPGALALGFYTGGILGRLSAEAWELVDLRPAGALRTAGVRPLVAGAAAAVPPSAHQLLTYTLYRFEICVRDTAVVGVVGAAGLGRLLAENLAAFRFPALGSVLAAFVAVSLGSEVLSRWARRSSR